MSSATAAATPIPGEEEIAARAGGENFPVSLRLLPPALRADLSSLYAFARLVDELGDSYQGDRLSALNGVQAAFEGALQPSAAPTGNRIVERAAELVRRRGLDARPFLDLIEANRVDQQKTAYETFDDLMGYCALSANPVGRVVLGVFGVSTPERVILSDAVCSGLQLAEHWQDVAEDAANGRVYLPAEDLRRFGVDPGDLRRPAPAGARLRALVAFESQRARRLIDEGAALVSSLKGWARLAVAGYVAGGRAAIDAIAAADFDPLGGPPKPQRLRIAGHGLTLLTGSRLRGPA